MLETYDVEHHERGIIIGRFESPQRFLEWASKSRVKWKGELSSEDGSRSFTETENYDEAYKLARYGWKEGLGMLKDQVEIADKAMAKPKAPLRKYDVFGHAPAPARAAAGEMFSMVNKGRRKHDKPVVKICTRLNYFAGTSTERVMKWGAALCSYINELEKSGHSVQLIGVFENTPCTDESGPDISLQIQMKAPEQRLSMSNIVFWLAHPSSLRRVKFAAFEKMDIQQWYGDGYGRSESFELCGDDTLYLSIDDSSYEIEDSLERIAQKHAALNQKLRTKKSKQNIKKLGKKRKKQSKKFKFPNFAKL